MRMYAPGRGGGRGAKRSPPVAPLSSLYRCGASLPNSSSFPHFQIHPSHLTVHIQYFTSLFYTHTLISKNSERSLVLSTLLIRLHSLQHSPIVQLIRNAACITRTRRASQRDTDRSVQDSRATPGHDRQYSVVINVEHLGLANDRVCTGDPREHKRVPGRPTQVKQARM